jgi:hypothetical protein
MWFEASLRQRTRLLCDDSEDISFCMMVWDVVTDEYHQGILVLALDLWLMYTKYPSTLVKFHDRYEVFQNAHGASLIHISIVIMLGEWPAGVSHSTNRIFWGHGGGFNFPE